MGQTCGEQIALLAPDFLYLGFVMPHESRSIVDRSTVIADVQAGAQGAARSACMQAIHTVYEPVQAMLCQQTVKTYSLKQ